MVELYGRFVLLQSRISLSLFLLFSILQLAHKDLELPELPYERLVQQESDVLGVVECLAARLALLRLLPVVGLARVDAFEDAQPSEIFEAELQLLQGMSPRYEFGCLSCIILQNKVFEQLLVYTKTGTLVLTMMTHHLQHVK